MRRKAKEDSGLIFDWSHRDGNTGRVLLSGLITLGAFVGLFFAFRIITPETRPVTTRPQQVLVLNPAVSAERALINRAMDRSFALIPTDSAAATLPAAAQMPQYRPALAAFELKLKPLDSGATTSERPLFFSLDFDAAPPRRSPIAQQAPEPPPSVLRAVLEGGAAGRLAQSRELPGIALVDPSRPRFRVAVGSRGQVLLALPLMASEDAGVMEQLRAAIMALRFTPDKKDLEWTQVSFRWEPEETP